MLSLHVAAEGPHLKYSNCFCLFPLIPHLHPFLLGGLVSFIGLQFQNLARQTPHFLALIMPYSWKATEAGAWELAWRHGEPHSMRE